MLHLKWLAFQNIGRFVERQTIYFDKLGNLVQVEGQNKNTGGSSGAAKSTIFKALNWNMGLDGPATTVLQSRLTKSPMEVISGWDWDGQEVRVERGKKLVIEIAGQTFSGSSKLTEEKLDEILGMPRDLFSKILHKKQGEQGFFLNMGPSEVHKFLTSCLGLDKEQAKLPVLDDRLQKLTDTESFIKSFISSAETGLDATSKAIASLGSEPVLEVGPEELLVLEDAHKKACYVQNQTEVEHKRQLDELEAIRPKISIAPFDRSRIVAVEAEIGKLLSQISEIEKKESERKSQVKAKISELQIAISNLNHAESTRTYQVKSEIDQNRSEHKRLELVVSQGSKAKDEALKLAEELKKVRISICPTCEQNWATDAVKAKEQSLLVKLQELKKLIIAGTTASARLVELDSEYKALLVAVQPRKIPEIEEINNQIAMLEIEAMPNNTGALIQPKLQLDSNNKILVDLRKEESDHQFKEKAKQQSIVDQFALKQTELRKKHDAVNELNRESQRQALSLWEDAKGKVRQFEQAKARYSESFAKLNEQKLKYEEQLSNKTNELAAVAEEIELATEAKKAIKSYLSASFEDALDSIGDMATKLVRSIPNMATATIQFDGIKETKDGKIKEEVNCVLSMDGEIGVPVKSLSGGERSSADTAIDLSAIKFIEERTGKGVDLMILDEPFTGLDTTNILEALEMLKESSLDKRLILVDHNPVAAQTIESRVTVVREGQTSSIVQQ